MDESGSSKSIQDIWNAKSRNIGPPEPKVIYNNCLFAFSLRIVWLI